MKLKCATCSREFESLIIDKTMAWSEVYGKLCNHVQKKHPDLMAELQIELPKVIMVLSSYITITMLAEIPEEDTHLVTLIDKMQGEVMEALGYDLGEEDEEEVEKVEIGDDKEFIPVTDKTPVIELPDSN